MTDGERLEEIVETAVARGDAPGVVAAVGRGDETHIATAGVMAVGGPPMRPGTLFRIASITKPVTAAVVLSLAEDGLLGLDEPVDRLLPELANRRVLRRPDGPLTDTIRAERAVTTRDLLTFTWGFGMQGAMFMAPEPWPIVSAVAERELSSFGPANPDTTPEPDTFMARLGELPLLAQPGERWLYSAARRCSACWPRARRRPVRGCDTGRVLAPLGMERHRVPCARMPAGSPPRTRTHAGKLTVRDRRTSSGRGRRGSPTERPGWCLRRPTWSRSAGCCCAAAVRC